MRTGSTPKNNGQSTKNPKHPNGLDIDPTYFDQFLKTTSPMTPMSTHQNEFSDSTTFESTTNSNRRNESEFDMEFDFINTNETQTNHSTISFDHDMYDNVLENSTEFRNEVEELFDSNKTRKKRFIPKSLDVEKKVQIIVSCHNAGGFTSSRQRWWYIALANCGSKKGIEASFRFIMTNGPHGDFWHEHFSADEMCMTFEKIGELSFLINFISF